MIRCYTHCNLEKWDVHHSAKIDNFVAIIQQFTFSLAVVSFSPKEMLLFIGMGQAVVIPISSKCNEVRMAEKSAIMLFSLATLSGSGSSKVSSHSDLIGSVAKIARIINAHILRPRIGKN